MVGDGSGCREGISSILIFWRFGMEIVGGHVLVGDVPSYSLLG